MAQYLKDQVDWPQPFPAEEYAARRAKTRTAMANAGINALYVTVPADLTWLTGYDMIWYHMRSLTSLLLETGSDDHGLFFDSPAHTTIVMTTPEIGDVAWFARGPVEDTIAFVAKTLAERGIGAGKTVATQRFTYGTHADTTDGLSAAIAAGGATVVDASFLVEGARLVKSPREVAVVRDASVIADSAMAAARDALRPGIKENEIEGVIMGELMKRGGGYPGIRTMIGSGPRAGTHHSPAQHRQVKQGELVFIDFCSALHRYHVNLNRTFSVGEPDPRWTNLMHTSAGCIDAIVDGIKPGDSMFDVHAIADDYTDSNGLRDIMWYNGGYTLGVAVPPDWVGNHKTHPTQDTPDDRPLETGMVFNLENQFDVWEDWPGGSGAAYIETFLMTDSGLEVLSKLPRNL
ncbi:MAG: Xaa-Pro peptidase family protein, partial [Pseudomonadota bacterium]|nr:Xaa-Pro peptidase family protein [Pseudomonadota bacterium]